MAFVLWTDSLPQTLLKILMLCCIVWLKLNLVFTAENGRVCVFRSFLKCFCICSFLSTRSLGKYNTTMVANGQFVQVERATLRPSEIRCRGKLISGASIIYITNLYNIIQDCWKLFLWDMLNLLIEHHPREHIVFSIDIWLELFLWDQETVTFTLGMSWKT